MVPGLRMSIERALERGGGVGDAVFQRSVVAHVDLGIDAKSRDLVLDVAASVVP